MAMGTENGLYSNFNWLILPLFFLRSALPTVEVSLIFVETVNSAPLLELLLSEVPRGKETRLFGAFRLAHAPWGSFDFVDFRLHFGLECCFRFLEVELAQASERA